jgi:hypothetical protein
MGAMKTVRSAAALAWAVVLAARPANAQHSDEQLAKQLANPVAALISVPFQGNVDFGYGSTAATKTILNVQPVYPALFTPHWNLVSRTILPIVYQEAFTDGGSSEFGLGDITQSLFFSPAASDPIWAVGPAFLIPTATDAQLGSGKWGIGPTGLVLEQHGPWTYGVLTNHIWSFAGKSDRADVSATFLQPFLSHTSAKALTLGLNSESTYDWTGNHWTVPINATVTQLVKFGTQRVSLGGGLRW